LRIGKEVILAPMAGYTNSAFRRLCRRLGADRVYSELMNATGILVRGPRRELVYFTDEERPIHLQVYGRNPEEIAEASLVLASSFKPDAVDINFGCSVKKVIKAKAAGYLLKFPEVMGKIVEETVKALKPLGIPVTVKMRLGFYTDELERISEEVLKAGVSAIALHPRTAVQGFSGKADWKRIGDLKRIAGDVPVMGSGDVKSWRDIGRMFRETGCDGVMVGRAALSNPWILREYREKRDIEVGTFERASFLLDELSMMTEFMERERACREIKSEAVHIFKGVHGRAQINRALMGAKSCSELVSVLNSLKEKP